MLDRSAEKSLQAPALVQESLRSALYSDSGSIITGTVLTAGSALFGWWICGGPFPLALALVSTAINGLRWAFAKLRRNRSSEIFDAAFVAATVVYLQCIGALTYWAFNGPQDVFVETLTTFVIVVNTMAIALRSFAIERLTNLYMAALVLPVAGALSLRGGYFHVVAFVEVLTALYTYRSATRLRGIFFSEITHRNRSETVAAQFRLSIDNMSHGMCMIDSDKRIVVSNPQLGQCFGMPGERSVKGFRFGALVRLARLRGALTAEDAARLQGAFTSPQGADGVTRLEAEGHDGRVRDLTLKRNDEGGWVLVAQDVTEQRLAREALDRAARLDAMTGLPNRATFEGRLAEALGSAQGRFVRTEVMFVDLDGFKQINDTLGHKCGDRVLAETASRLRQAVGGGAFVARWGGDEFVVLRQIGPHEATSALAERLIADLSRPIWVEGAQVEVGASVGASICLDGFTPVDTLLQQADMALCAAKREARGTCKLFETAMNDQARERRLLELDLQAALAARTFELRYQPIVDLETGELVSFEALAQWRHPTRGVVSPNVFVPRLEDMNLMHGFGAWALQRACEDAASWPVPARVGVNVSARQIDTLVEAVKRALASSGLAPGRLELEITETAALEGGEDTIRALEAVRALGCRIALDDFGTGYSSLSHLLSLPLDKVKIDKGFTQQLGISRKADLLVSSIARLSSQMGMRVTFEGVETTEQLDRARAVGVAAEGQGWLFGRAALAADLGPVFAQDQAQRAVA